MARAAFSFPAGKNTIPRPNTDGRSIPFRRACFRMKESGICVRRPAPSAMRQAAQHLECTLYDLMRAAMPKPCDEADTTCIMVDGELIARHPSCVSSTDLESTIENFDGANGFFEQAL